VLATAVVRDGQLNGVFVVDRDQIARFRLVRTGKTYDDQVEIVSGLQQGQRYVAAVPPTLKDGMPVEVR
jgi:multidrug efflux pump subunit AcrA (membrane-fusion protein)